MRGWLVGAALLGLTMQAPARAQSVELAEQVAFNIRATQSFLMVSALLCGRDDDYNRIVMKFRTDLAKSLRTIEGYFRKSYGRGAQGYLDDYITVLANMHSQVAIGQAGRFCENSAVVWAEAHQQPNVLGLSHLAARHAIPNWIDENQESRSTSLQAGREQKRFR